MFASLETARDALADIDGVATCRIGLEAGISPADYPLVRLVPSRMVPGRPYTQRTAECLIYYGMDTGASETGGLQQVYSDLFSLEAEILEVIKAIGGRYIDTVTDEDRLDTFKLCAIRCELFGAQPVPIPQLTTEIENILLTEVGDHITEEA